MLFYSLPLLIRRNTCFCFLQPLMRPGVVGNENQPRSHRERIQLRLGLTERCDLEITENGVVHAVAIYAFNGFRFYMPRT